MWTCKCRFQRGDGYFTCFRWELPWVQDLWQSGMRYVTQTLLECVRFRSAESCRESQSQRMSAIWCLESSSHRSLVRQGFLDLMSARGSGPADPDRTYTDPTSGPTEPLSAAISLDRIRGCARGVHAWIRALHVAKLALLRGPLDRHGARRKECQRECQK